MKTVDIHGMTNMELVQGGTDEWYWATDFINAPPASQIYTAQIRLDG